jgi:hypothetical protein
MMQNAFHPSPKVPTVSVDPISLQNSNSKTPLRFKENA